MIRSLKKKVKCGIGDVSDELTQLQTMEAQALACFDDDVRYMIQAVDTLIDGLKIAKEM